jgi:hypothetical protein
MRQAMSPAGINPLADVWNEAYTTDSVEPNTNVVYVLDAEPPRMTGIRVDGDTAVARYPNGERTRLRRLNHWLIDSF